MQVIISEVEGSCFNRDSAEDGHPMKEGDVGGSEGGLELGGVASVEV